jgi:hypothetical protein
VGEAWLRPTAAFFALAVILHNADHLRRGVDATGRDVLWLGTAGIALEVLIVALIFARHRWAPLVAAVVGFNLAIGYVVVHFLPARSWFSDSFTSAQHVSWLSWSATSLEVVAAVMVATVACAVLASRGGVAVTTSRSPTPDPDGGEGFTPSLWRSRSVRSLL